MTVEKIYKATIRNFEMTNMFDYITDDNILEITLWAPMGKITASFTERKVFIFTANYAYSVENAGRGVGNKVYNIMYHIAKGNIEF